MNCTHFVSEYCWLISKWFWNDFDDFKIVHHCHLHCFEFRVITLIDWLPLKARDSNLPAYLTYSWRREEEMNPCFSHGMSAKLNVKLGQNLNLDINSSFHVDNCYATHTSFLAIVFLKFFNNKISFLKIIHECKMITEEVHQFWDLFLLNVFYTK